LEAKNIFSIILYPFFKKFSHTNQPFYPKRRRFQVNYSVFEDRAFLFITAFAFTWGILYDPSCQWRDHSRESRLRSTSRAIFGQMFWFCQPV